MKRYFNSRTVSFMGYAILSLFAKIITSSEPRPLITLSFEGTSAQYHITNPAVLNFFSTLANAQRANAQRNRDTYYIVKGYTPLVISFLLQLAEQFVRFNSFVTPNTTQLLADFNINDLLTAIKAAKALGASHTLQQFLLELLQRRRAQETAAPQQAPPQQQRTAMPTSAPSPAAPPIIVIVAGKQFAIDSATLPYVKTLKDNAEAMASFGDQSMEPFELSFIQDADSFQFLLTVIKACFIALKPNENHSDILRAILQQHSLKQICALTTTASYLHAEELLPLLFDWFIDLLMKKTPQSDLELIMNNLNKDLLNEIKKRLLKPIEKQITRNCIYTSEPQTVSLPTTSNEQLFFLTLAGMMVCFKQGQQFILFDLISKQQKATLNIQTHNLNNVSTISDDGTIMIVASRTKLYVWHITTNIITPLPIDLDGSFFITAISPDNKKICYATDTASCTILYGDDFKKTKSIDRGDYKNVASLSWSLDSRYCIISSHRETPLDDTTNSTLIIYDGKLERQITGKTYEFETSELQVATQGENTFLALDAEGNLSLITITETAPQLTIHLMHETPAPGPDAIICSHSKQFILELARQGNTIIDIETGFLMKQFTSIYPSSFMPHDTGLLIWNSMAQIVQQYSFTADAHTKALTECLKRLNILQVKSVLELMSLVTNGVQSDTIQWNIIKGFEKVDKKDITTLQTFLDITQKIYALNIRNWQKRNTDESSASEDSNSGSESESESTIEDIYSTEQPFTVNPFTHKPSESITEDTYSQQPFMVNPFTPQPFESMNEASEGESESESEESSEEATSMNIDTGSQKPFIPKQQ